MSSLIFFSEFQQINSLAHYCHHISDVRWWCLQFASFNINLILCCICLHPSCHNLKIKLLWSTFVFKEIHRVIWRIQRVFHYKTSDVRRSELAVSIHYRQHCQNESFDILSRKAAWHAWHKHAKRVVSVNHCWYWSLVTCFSVNQHVSGFKSTKGELERATSAWRAVATGGHTTHIMCNFGRCLTLREP